MLEDCYHLRKGSCEIGRSDDECCMACTGYLRRSRCEVWTRVMGYHRPITSFNIGKKQEHADRLHFAEFATT